jgi:hypothetical protein
MPDFGIYWKNFAKESKQGDWPCSHWFTNSERLRKAVSGDHFWLFTSGDTCDMTESKMGYLVEIFTVQDTISNSGNNSDYPSQDFGYVVNGDCTRCLEVEPPLLVDPIIREKETGPEIPIGRVRQGPWKMKEEMASNLKDFIRNERAGIFEKIFSDDL